jgi:preprotein translocase subunit SecA
LNSDSLKDFVKEKIRDYVTDNLSQMSDSSFSETSIDKIKVWFESRFPLFLKKESFSQAVDADDAAERLFQYISEIYDIKEKYETPEKMREMERFLCLTVIDRLWKEQLYNMDDLRSSIGLRSYGQRDPLVEYKAEGYYMFENMMGSVTEEIATGIFRITSLHAGAEITQDTSSQQTVHQSVSALSEEPLAQDMPSAPASKPMPIKKDVRVGRNDPCPCGSGKKYKKCCGT